MNNEIKVSEAISLPVRHDLDGSIVDSYGDKLLISVDDSVDVDLIATSINSYDSNQELIAKLYSERDACSSELLTSLREVCILKGDISERDATITKQAEQIELLQSELGSLISACERNSGHEPSLSVYQFTLDFARKALASTKPKPFDNDALINILIEKTGGEV